MLSSNSFGKRREESDLNFISYAKTLINTFDDLISLQNVSSFETYIWLSIFFLFSMNEPEVGIGIDPGMAFNPFPSSILDKTRQDSTLQPLDRESSPLTTRPDLRPFLKLTLYTA